MADQLKTINLLRKGHVSYKQIEDDTGITINWLTRFANDSIVHVDSRMVDCLYKYLTREDKHRIKQAESKKCKEKKGK